MFHWFSIIAWRCVIQLESPCLTCRHATTCRHCFLCLTGCSASVEFSVTPCMSVHECHHLLPVAAGCSTAKGERWSGASSPQEAATRAPSGRGPLSCMETESSDWAGTCMYCVPLRRHSLTHHCSSCLWVRPLCFVFHGHKGTVCAIQKRRIHPSLHLWR